MHGGILRGWGIHTPDVNEEERRQCARAGLAGRLYVPVSLFCAWDVYSAVACFPARLELDLSRSGAVQSHVVAKVLRGTYCIGPSEAMLEVRSNILL